VVMILGALSISSAVAGEGEHSSMNEVLVRECRRYNLDYDRVLAEYRGDSGNSQESRGWWDYLIVAFAAGIFVWLGWNAAIPPIAINPYWLAALALILLITLGACCWALWRMTKFS